MTIGTKSSLYGAHQFLLHPLMLAIAWTKLYGFPLDPRLYVAFLIHDWGYFGCTDMDGPSGSRHPERGARIMSALFGKEWGDFCLFHSRSYAKDAGQRFSRLCVADKYATAILPVWLQAFLVSLTGEIEEYMSNPQIKSTAIKSGDVRLYCQDFVAELKKWVEANKDFDRPSLPAVVAVAEG
jgi:hypothetical protein